MIFDWDDLTDRPICNKFIDRMWQLKLINPDFKATLFAVPNRCNERFLDTIPNWLELAVHGWDHTDCYECKAWTKEDLFKAIDHPKVKKYFAKCFKAPGWQISTDCFYALQERNWIVADQGYNSSRRPEQLRAYILRPNGKETWHGHVNNCCNNGLFETWEQVVELVRGSDNFKFVTEVV